MTERFPFGPASTARNPPCGVLLGASLSMAIERYQMRYKITG